MEVSPTFGQIVRERRMTLGLTQAELARRVHCATVTIRKIEYDSLRPSVQVAERLALSLNVDESEQSAFVRLARSDLPQTPLPTPTPIPEEIGQEDLRGRSVLGYDLGERIGTGGFGVVYRAVQRSVEREVAVKIILPEYANQPPFIRRFEYEAQTVAQLEHPYIVPLYDYWREPDAAYLIMRFLRGGSLETRLRQGPISLQDAQKYLHQVCQGLHLAHRQGLVHRDIKPANILLDEDHNAYLSDFGIAKYLEIRMHENEKDAGAFAGSPVYASPEELRSEPVRPETDIYSLGILLYEMLAGEKPFPGPTPALYAQQHLREPLPSIAAKNPTLPPVADAILLKATAKDARERYPGVPAFLEALQAVWITVDGLAVAVDRSAATLSPLSVQEFAELENPYKGLRAFSEADSENFFGRDNLVHDMLGRVGQSANGRQNLTRFLAVVGPSGSGKSSVVKAGLIPALRQGGVPGSADWFVVDVIPGARPMAELASALMRVAVQPPHDMTEQLRSDERGLLRVVNKILPADESTELLLVIDQFEEIFTLVEDEAVRAHFLDSLVTAILDEDSRLRIVVTMRADFLDRPLQYVDFAELIRQRTEFVPPLNADELEEAITQPLLRLGMALEPGLLARIIHDVGDEPGKLPLLQYALTELFEQRNGALLTREAYEVSGGVLGALGSRAADIYARLNPTAQAATRQLFIRLITLGQGREVTRRRVLRSELLGLSSNGNPSSAIQTAIAEFGRFRLLTFDHDPETREPTVEVAHEALLREWDLLGAWLEGSRADIRTQRQLTRAADEWQESGRDSSFLIPGGARLQQFIRWRNGTDLALTQVEEDYLQASILADAERKERQARQARTRRNLRRGLIGVLIVGFVVALGLSIFAFGQQRLANEQRQEALHQASIGLASLAERELGGIDQELSVLLALEALEKYPFTPQAAGALALSVDSFRPYRTLDPGDSLLSLIMVATWSPDGSRIAAATSPSPDSVIIWDAATGNDLLSVNTHGDLCQENFNLLRDLVWSPSADRLAAVAQDAVSGDGCGVVLFDATSGQTLLTLQGYDSAGRSLDWAPDGKTMLTAHENGTIRIWDIQTGEERSTLTGHEGIVYDAVFDPDGSRIASASEDGTVRLWDVTTGAELRTFGDHFGPVQSVAWSPQGTRLVSGGNDGLARVWDVATGEVSLVLPGHTEGVVIVSWSTDGRRIASQSLDATVKVWDAATGGMLFEIPNTAPETETKRGFVQFSPDGEWILAGGSRVLGPRIWQVSVATPILSGHTLGQEWGGWSPDGALIATSSEDGSARLWDATTGQQLREFDQGSYWGDWSPDGSRLVFAEGIGEYALNVWDVSTGDKLATLSVPQDGYGAPRFLTMDWSPDGASIVAAGLRPGTPQPLYIWDAETGQLIKTLQTDDTCMLGWPRWSPDSTRIATGCIFVQPGLNTPARIWDVAGGSEIMVLESDFGWTYHTNWSPDGTQLLATYENGVARIWDVATGEPTLTFAGHQGQVDGAWSPDGTLIATTDYAEQLVKIWNPQTAEELFSFFVSGAPLTIGWSPDGAQIIVTGDGLNEPVIKRAWRSPEELIDYAYDCCVSRRLTPEERERFGLPETP